MQAGRMPHASPARAPLGLGVALAGAALAFTVGVSVAGAQQGPESSLIVRPLAGASMRSVVRPERPGNYDNEMWRKMREGPQVRFSISDKKGGQLVQSDGEAWRRNFRDGSLPKYGLSGMGGTLVLLAAFFMLRGRISIEHGWAGRTIKRFSGLERFGHWLLATSFVILALTGLNVLYGRYLLLPLIGPSCSTRSRCGANGCTITWRSPSWPDWR